jgi:CBS-domain-containing membrane protein
VYVTDGEGHLNGVISLRDLVLARPGTPVTEFMQSRVAAVGLLDSQDDAAHLIAKYNLSAVPVVDEERRLQGSSPPTTRWTDHPGVEAPAYVPLTLNIGKSTSASGRSVPGYWSCSP